MTTTRTLADTNRQLLAALDRPARPASPVKVAHRLTALRAALCSAAEMLDGPPCLTDDDVIALHTMAASLDKLADAAQRQESHTTDDAR